MKKQFLLLCLILIPVLLSAQTDKSSYGIKFTGFVKSDFFYDTRQTVNIREGHFLLYPSGTNYDKNGNDINASPTTNFLSIQTRLLGNITAPDAFGAKVTGLIEADFFGNENASFVDANGFRLRHAYAKLSWDNTELLFGQFWHPLFVPASFSEVISFNTGAPFQPFSRNPQMKITQKFGQFSVIAALCEQRDFTSPEGSNILRNAVLPEFQGQIQFENKFESGASLLLGAGGGYKVVKPLQFTEFYNATEGKTYKYKTDETLGGFSSTAFLKFQNSDFTYKLQGIYGQNLFDLTMLGGYGITEIITSPDYLFKYAPINTFSAWTEFITKVSNFQLALYAGYTENLGADEKIISFSNKAGGTLSTMRGSAADNSSAIKNILRVSPRIVLVTEKINFAFELEYTMAGYAKKNANGTLMRDEYGKITDTENISNIRSLFAVILKF